MHSAARGEVTAFGLVAAGLFLGTLGSAAPQQKPAKPGKPTTARPATPRPSPTPRPAFRVEIEQEGRLVAIADHRVVLKRAPFDIVLTLAPGDSVALRASSAPELFQRARRGSPLGADFNPAQTGAEGAGNPDRELWIDRPNLQHAFSYDPKDRDHRFNECVPRESGLVRCRRSVAKLDATEPAAVEAYPSPSLYLVFLAGSSSKDYTQTVETGREFVVLVFEDATADLPLPRPDPKQSPAEALVALVFAKDVATVKAHLADGLKTWASRRSALDQQLFYEGMRVAETARLLGGRVERRGKASKPEIFVEIPDKKMAIRFIFEKERIEGDRASIDFKGRLPGGKEERPLRVRMVRQAAWWRLAGLEVTGEKESPWSNLEDGKAFELLEATHRTANESRTIMDLRTLISAEAFVTSVNGGYYLPPECLEDLARCIPGYSGPPAVTSPPPWATTRNGYRISFVPGPRPSSASLKKAKASPSSLGAYSFVAVPDKPGESGTRGFCADNTGLICVTRDGSAHAVRNGECAQPCSVLQ